MSATETDEIDLTPAPLSAARSWVLTFFAAIVGTAFINALGVVEWTLKALHYEGTRLENFLALVVVIIVSAPLIRFRLTWLRTVSQVIHCFMMWLAPVVLWGEILDYQFLGDVEMPVTADAAYLLIFAVWACCFVAHLISGKTVRQAVAYGLFGGAFFNGIVIWLLYLSFMAIGAFLPALLEAPNEPDAVIEMQSRPATAAELASAKCRVYDERFLQCSSAMPIETFRAQRQPSWRDQRSR